MKRRVLARIKIEKAKRAGRSARRPSSKAKDPKDLRGAKGVLVKRAAEEAAPAETLRDARYPRVRIGDEG